MARRYSSRAIKVSVVLGVLVPAGLIAGEVSRIWLVANEMPARSGQPGPSIHARDQSFTVFCSGCVLVPSVFVVSLLLSSGARRPDAQVVAVAASLGSPDLC